DGHVTGVQTCALPIYYYLKHEAFSAWIDRLDADDVNVWNPVATLRWNLDKIYLHELAQKGIPVTPTVFAKQGDRLAGIAAEKGRSEERRVGKEGKRER